MKFQQGATANAGGDATKPSHAFGDGNVNTAKRAQRRSARVSRGRSDPSRRRTTPPGQPTPRKVLPETRKVPQPQTSDVSRIYPFLLVRFPDRVHKEESAIANRMTMETQPICLVKRCLSGTCLRVRIRTSRTRPRLAQQPRKVICWQDLRLHPRQRGNHLRRNGGCRFLPQQEIQSRRR